MFSIIVVSLHMIFTTLLVKGTFLGLQFGISSSEDVIHPHSKDLDLSHLGTVATLNDSMRMSPNLACSYASLAWLLGQPDPSITWRFAQYAL